MALTWTPVEQVSNDTLDATTCDFAYAPDKSVVFIYDRDAPATGIEGQLGVYLRKRKRDGSYLAPYKIDDLPGDSLHIDVVADTTKRARLTSQWRCIVIDSAGNTHVIWQQAGRGGTTNSIMCYRKFTNDGDEDSYGTPSDVYYTLASQVVAQSGCLAVNPIDGTVYICYAYSNRARLTYIRPGDAAGQIDSFRTMTLAYHSSIGAPTTSATQGAYIDCDPYGNLHYCLFDSTTQWSLSYGYRTLGATLPDVSNPSATGWQEPELVLAVTGSGLITRGYATMKARGITDVSIVYQLHTTTNETIRCAERFPSVAWGDSQISSSSTSTDRSYPCVDGSHKRQESMVAAWYDKRNSTDEGIYYVQQVNGGTWSADAQAVYRDTSGSKLLTHVRLVYRHLNRTPYQLGLLTKSPGYKLGVAFIQRDA